MALERSEIVSVYRGMLFGDPDFNTVPLGDNLLSFVAAYLPRDPDRSILDAGCGNGRYMRTGQWS